MTGASLLGRARAAAAAVPDPEIPVITLEDLGILREVRAEGGRVVVMLTPTYTGCPATEVIRQDVLDALAAAGIAQADVRVTLSPPWTTDWITEEGRRKLREYGIAPPACAASGAAGDRAAGAGTAPLRFMPNASPALPSCPRCGGAQTERLSEHGSTPCKALYRCIACREPFDYFKPY